MSDAVHIEGLAELRRDLRAMQPDVLREVLGVLKDGERLVADRGRELAPRGHRAIPVSRRPRVRLADSLRPGTAGNTAFVRSPAAYGLIQEKRSRFMSRALHDSENQIVDLLGDSVDAVADRHGWK